MWSRLLLALTLAWSTPLLAAGINHFQIASGPQNFWVTDSGQILPHLVVGGWLIGDYAKDPLTCNDANGDEAYAIVNHQVNAEAAVSFGLFDRIELGIALPGHILRGDAVPASAAVVCGGFDAGGVSEVNIGDPRLIAKVLLTPKNEGLVASLRLQADLPLAQFNAAARPFTGESLPNVRPAIAVGYASDAFKAGVDVGYLLRAPNQIGELTVGHEITYGAGAELAIVPRTAYFTVDVFGRAGPQALFANRSSFPLEAAAGVKVNVGPAVISLGGGTGLIADYGAPDFRVFAGVGYLPRPAPEVVEIEPGPTDRDGDGIFDDDDECPDAPEDKDKFEDEDGCPDVDNDDDGILDIDDECPMEPEDRDRWEDADGCPDLDNDEDKILDKDDECPNDPEVYNEFEDEDGCPDSRPEDDKKVVVVVRRDRVEIKEKVFFAYDSDRILPKSFDLLDNVSRVIKEHQEIPQIVVEGHTDSDGSDTYNKDLSERRAASVKAYMIAAGVNPERLESQGYGEEQPVADNDTDAGKAENRRVEFKIVNADGEVSDKIESESASEPEVMEVEEDEVEEGSDEDEESDDNGDESDDDGDESDDVDDLLLEDE